jgi:peptidoglycan/LPS O-acetylase OafA/YrhL
MQKTNKSGSVSANLSQRYPTLDGWRGVSILLVLAGHLLPIGPKSLELNGAVAATGMAIFFILSGFLIASMLLHDDSIINFLIRRFARIVPLAWLCVCLVFFTLTPSLDGIVNNLLFIANWEPMALQDSMGHFWSLCVEAQFYVLAALLFALLHRRAIYLLPVLCFAVTAYRFHADVKMAINTYYRLDEILSGCMLAIIFNRQNLTTARILKKFPTGALFMLLIASAHPASGTLNYLRPYIAATLVGSTLFGGGAPYLVKQLNSRFLSYIAQVSFAVYLIHGIATHTWLGSGNTMEKYAKRPLLFAITFALAHLSTFYFERFFTDTGRKLVAARTVVRA